MRSVNAFGHFPFAFADTYAPRYGTLKHEKKKTSAYSTVVLISSYLDTCMNTSLKFRSYLNTVLEPSLLKYGQVPTSIPMNTVYVMLCQSCRLSLVEPSLLKYGT